MIIKNCFLILVSLMLCNVANANAFNPILDVEANGQSALKPPVLPHGGDAKPGPIIVIGKPITWKYTVINDGNVPINNITVTGRQKQPEIGNWEPLCTIGTIAAGETGFCESFDQATEGIHKILIAVRGTTNAGEASSVSTDAFYLGQNAYTRISVASDGSQGNNASSRFYSSISADGRYIAFRSSASNLVPDDHNDVDDIFVHDQVTGETTRVSVTSDGTELLFHSTSPSISGDGRYVAFSTDNDQRPRIAVTHIHDRITGETRFFAYGNIRLAFSFDARFIMFEPATHIDPVTGDIHSVRNREIFVHDQVTGETTLITANIDESVSYQSISNDDRYIVFLGIGARDEKLFFYDQVTSETTFVAEKDNIFSSISNDGNYITFIDHFYGASNAHLTIYDRVAGETTLSIPVDSQAESPTFTPDKQFIIYTARTDEGLQIYAVNRVTGENILLDSILMDELQKRIYRQISSDGNAIVFASSDSNLVPDDTNNHKDIFLYHINEPSPAIPELEPPLMMQTQVNGQNTTKPGPTISAGTNLTWTYTAVNDGNTALHNVQVLSRQKLPSIGPWEIICNLGTVDPGESMTCEAFDLAIENTYKALTIVRGTINTGETLEASSIAFYKGEQGSVPALSLDVTADGSPMAKPGPALTEGEMINWNYSVTNDGQSVLNNVEVRGRQKLPGLGSWETLCTIASIQPGATSNCSTTNTAVVGIYKALIVARTSNIEDSAIVFYRGEAATSQQLALSLVVTANGLAIKKPGPLIPAGDTIQWKYTVTNDGNGPLQNILITQRQKIPSLGSWETPCTIPTIAPGETISCSSTTTAIADNYKALIVARSTLDNGDNIEDKVDGFYRH